MLLFLSGQFLECAYSSCAAQSFGVFCKKPLALVLALQRILVDLVNIHFGSWRQSHNSTFTAHTLYSGIFATGSRAAIVSSLAEASGKWKLAYTIPGGTRSVTQASASMAPRRELILTRFFSVMPILAASSGLTSTRGCL